MGRRQTFGNIPESSVLPSLRKWNSEGNKHLAKDTVYTSSNLMTQRDACDECQVTALQNELKAVQRNYESISSMIQLKQAELTKALDDLEKERAVTVNLKKDRVDTTQVNIELEEIRKDCRSKEEQICELKISLAKNRGALEEKENEMIDVKQELVIISGTLDNEVAKSRLLQKTNQEHVSSIEDSACDIWMSNFDARANTRTFKLLTKMLPKPGIQGLKSKCSELEGSEAKLKQETQHLQEHVAHLINLNTELQCIGRQQFSRIEEAQAQLDSAGAALADALQDAACHANRTAQKQAEITSLEAQVQAVSERSSLLESQLHLKVMDWESACTRLSELRADLQDAKDAKLQMNKSLEDCRSQNRSLTTQLQQAHTQLDTAKLASASTEGQAEAALHEVTTLRAVVSCKESRIAQLDAALGGLEAKLAAQQEALSAHQRQQSLLVNNERRKWSKQLHSFEQQLGSVEQGLLACGLLATEGVSSLAARVQSTVSELDHALAHWACEAAQIENTCREFTKPPGLEPGLHKATCAVKDLQERLRSAERKSEHAALQHEQAIKQLVSRYQEQLDGANLRLSGRVECLQGEVAALRRTAQDHEACWQQRVESERSQHRKAKEELLVQVHQQQQHAAVEKRQMEGQLTVVSRQHQLKLAERNALLAKAEERNSALKSALLGGVTAFQQLPDHLVLLENHLRRAGVLGDGIGDLEASRMVMSDVREMDEAITELKAYFTHLAEACRSQCSQPPQHQTKLVLPSVSVQERTLRAIVDKLVHVERSLESNYSCLQCLSILRDPVIVCPSGHCFCRCCIAVDEPQCPECGENRLPRVLPASNLDKLAAKFQFKLNALLDLQRMVEGCLVVVS